MIGSDSIGIIGTGNTAWQLAHHFINSGLSLKYIASRNILKAQELANLFGIESFHINELGNHYVDGIFICVTDSAISEVSEQLLDCSNWQVHCCGSVSIEALTSPKKGVYYPLQTMTKGRLLETNKIPICLETNDDKLRKELNYIAGKCGMPVFNLNSHKRAKAHISAVMVNNFVNHILHKSMDFAKENNIEESLFLPLAFETIEKAFKLGGFESQTGPARRNNKAIIAQHEENLSDYPMTKELYQFISKSIMKEFEKP